MQNEFRAWNGKEMQVVDLRIDWFKFENEQYKIMPYIGFKDRNQKKVYKDDIVRNSAGWIGIVFFCEKDLQWKMRGVKDAPGYGSIQTFSWYIGDDLHHWLEVIGNVHENPELTERKNLHVRTIEEMDKTSTA